MKLTPDKLAAFLFNSLVNLCHFGLATPESARAAVCYLHHEETGAALWDAFKKLAAADVSVIGETVADMVGIELPGEGRKVQ